MFEWAHLYVWQALIMLDVLVVWLIWVRTLPRDDGDAAAARRRARHRRRPDGDPRVADAARSLPASSLARAARGCR